MEIRTLRYFLAVAREENIPIIVHYSALLILNEHTDLCIFIEISGAS